MYKVVLRSLTVLLTGLPPNLYREQELHSVRANTQFSAKEKIYSSKYGW